jgi:hypothetical protein
LLELSGYSGKDNSSVQADILLVKALISEDKLKLWGGHLKNANVLEIIKNKKNQKIKEEKILSEKQFIQQLIKNTDINRYIGINEFDGVKYYNKERFENLIDWVFSLQTLAASHSLLPKKTGKVSGKGILKTRLLKDVEESYKFYKRIKEASLQAEFKVDKLITSFEEKPEAKRTKKVTVKKPAVKKDQRKKSSNKKRG